MINVAVLGYGVVGSGVVEVLSRNRKSIAVKASREVKVKYIADIKDIQDDVGDIIVTKDAMDAINDDEVKVLVETIGGVGVAYKFTKAALEAGKHVVTSNKELVATHGPELLELARNNVNYLFEASVGGGIPIIRPLNQCLAANEIHGITGILNGTTNYVLTKMFRESMDFQSALKNAQANGYAEADPTADIEGHDACRKIAILSSISYGQFVDCKKIPTEGISNITIEDMQYADQLGKVIKLIAMSRKLDGKVYASVGPTMIDRNHPLANVEDVFNGILVEGDAIGDVMFYGRGAGKLPTASAVVADIIDIAKNIDRNNRISWKVKSEDNMVSPEEMKFKFFVRIEFKSGAGTEQAVRKIFGDVRFLTSINENEVVFTTGKISQKKLDECISLLGSAEGVSRVAVVLKILDESA